MRFKSLLLALSAAVATPVVADTILASDAQKYVGQIETVVCLVSNETVNKNVAFLDLSAANIHETLTIVSLPDTKSLSMKSYLQLKGKSIPITGRIVDYRGEPQIDLTTFNPLPQNQD